jgi:acylphosphatase
VSEETTKSVRIIVKGRVQGVWFRAWTQQEAQKRGLSGWVRNRMDGSVEALFYGPKNVVNDMMEACWNGPPSARVDSLTPDKTEEIPGHGDFRTYPTV